MTIVVGVDGSIAAERALTWAVGEADRRRTRLDVIHAWSFAVGGHTAATRLELVADASQLLLDRQVALARTIGPGVEIAGVLVQGSAADTLVDLASAADLLVVGSRGHGVLASLVIGSVAGACLRHATTPVAVVKHSGVDERRRIVVGIDGSDTSMRALDWAAAEARLRNVRLTVLHAWRPPFASELTTLASTPAAEAETIRSAEVTLRSALASIRGTGSNLEVDGMVVRGAPDEVLLDAAASASLLVVGSRGHGAVAGMVLGSVSARCVHEAACPVVVLPHAETLQREMTHSSAMRSL